MAGKSRKTAKPRGADQLTTRFAAATAHLNKGAVADAERLYREIIVAQPRHADALHNLGIICAQSGRLDEARSLIQRALALQPKFAAAHNSLGIIERKLGRADDAVRHYERAIALDANYADALGNLGLALRVQGKLDQAIARLTDAALLKPSSAEARLNLGKALREAERFDEALDAFERALALKPELIEALTGSANTLSAMKRFNEARACFEKILALRPDHADVHFGLGTLAQGRGDLDDAIAFYRRALELKPDFAEAHGNLANALKDQGKLDEALRHYRRAHEIKPDFVEGLCNLGAALQEKGELDEASAVLERAVALHPSTAAAHVNLGAVRLGQNRGAEAMTHIRCAIALDPNSAEAQANLCGALLAANELGEAIEAGERAVALDPKHHVAQFNRSVALLAAGKFAEGWEGYEYRPNRRHAARRLATAPLWRLDAPPGRRVLVYPEQGLGDAIQFVRYLPMLVARGDHVVLEAWTPLRRLFAGLRNVDVVGPGEPPGAVDFQISLASLPRAFGTRLDTIPSDVPYLKAEPSAVEQFRVRLGAEGFKVGLVWRGNPGHKNDHNRSLDPVHLKPLFDVAGVRLFNLQIEPRVDDLDVLAGFGALEDLTGELTDFADTAALIEALDVVIAVDTSVAHLAGALGRPVWLLVPHGPDWRWLTEREDSPWYPTMRLFRQRAPGDWVETMARVVEGLRAMTPASGLAPRARPVAETRFDQALRQQRAGKAAEAAELLEAILRETPGHVPALFNLGVLRFQQGDIGAAAPLLERAITLKPDHAEAHNGLGAVRERQGRLDDAAACFARAIALHPKAPELHLNLAIALRRVGRHDQAIASAERALSLKPDHVETMASLGLALRDAGRYDEAVAQLARALELQPERALRHLDYANVLFAAGRFDDAEKHYRRAIELEPNYAEAHANLAMTLKNLGRLDEAIAAFEAALLQQPEAPKLRKNYGIALREAGRNDDAIVQFLKAVELKPDYPEAYNNLGVAFASRDRSDDACAAYERALALRPGFAKAQLNRANLAYDDGRLADAIAEYREALDKEPTMPEGHFSLAVALLTLGQFDEGWAEHEWRWRHSGAKPHSFPTLPLWSQTAPKGSRVVIHAEQGFGDTIMFARYAPLMVRRGHHVMLRAPNKLRRLLGSIDDVEILPDVIKGLKATHQIPFPSLPFAFGTRLDSIPSDVPYLAAPANAAGRFRAKLEGPGLKVGLAWRGNPKHKNDRNRSLDPAALQPLFGLDGIRFVNLQKQPREGDLERLRAMTAFEDVAAELDDFADTAALIEALDLVISVDTSVVHLAGALGKPVWVLLPFVADWRWLTKREDSPWYPSARLFRQRSRGDWPEVMARVAEALRARRDGHAPLTAAGSKRGIHSGVETAADRQRRALRSGDAVALTNRAVIALEQGHAAEAIEHCRRALARAPDHAHAHTTLALLYRGEFGAGWDEYEWRYQPGDEDPKPTKPAPPWTPELAPGALTIVEAEQGVGDEIMYASMFGDLIATGARVHVEADRRLIPLFTRSFPAAKFLPRQSGPNRKVVSRTVVHSIPAGSLARYFRRAEHDFPKRPYLKADDARRAALRASLDTGERLCGLSWSTNRAVNTAQRTPALADWAPVLSIPGVRFVNLQYDAHDAGLETLARLAPGGIAVAPSLDTRDDLDGLAALIEALDLVITIGNSTGHLAGALGKETWVLLPAVPNWQWFLEREDSPWYGSTRLFRQRTPGAWGEVMARVAGALRP